MSVVIRLKVPIEMHYTVIPMGTSKVNSSCLVHIYIYIYINIYKISLNNSAGDTFTLEVPMVIR